MQEFRFKYKTSPEIQERFKEHVTAHEMFMTEQAKRSPAFAQQLAALQMFPMFYVEQVAPVSPMPTMAPAQVGQMSQGLPAAPGLPVNPLVGGEPQLPTLEPQPNLEAQQAGGPVPPVEPTKST
jgi:hypothetical protein